MSASVARYSILSSTRGARAAIIPSVRVGSGTYGDGETREHMDPNGFKWKIEDNDCFTLAGCTEEQDAKRYFAYAYAGPEGKYYCSEDTSQYASSPGAIVSKIDAFASGKICEASSASLDDAASRAKYPETDIPQIEADSYAHSTDSIGGTVDPPVDVAAPASAPASYSAGAGTTAASDPSFARIQTALIRLGYQVGSTGADGKPGPKTSAAIKKFKGNHGLPADDVVDGAFRGALAAAQARAAAGAPSKTSTTTIALVVGGLVVAGLVVWKVIL